MHKKRLDSHHIFVINHYVPIMNILDTKTNLQYSNFNLYSKMVFIVLVCMIDTL